MTGQEPAREFGGQLSLTLIDSYRVVEARRLRTGDIDLRCQIGECRWRMTALAGRVSDVVGSHITLKHVGYAEPQR